MSLVEEIEQINKQIRKLEIELKQKKELLRTQLVSRGDYTEGITSKMEQSLVTINRWLGIEIPKRCYYDKPYCHKFIGQHLKDAVTKSREYYKRKNNL